MVPKLPLQDQVREAAIRGQHWAGNSLLTRGLFPWARTPAQHNPIKVIAASMGLAEEKQQLRGKEGGVQHLSRKPDGLEMQETISLDGK